MAKIKKSSRQFDMTAVSNDDIVRVVSQAVAEAAITDTEDTPEVYEDAVDAYGDMDVEEVVSRYVGERTFSNLLWDVCRDLGGISAIEMLHRLGMPFCPDPSIDVAVQQSKQALGLRLRFLSEITPMIRPAAEVVIDYV